MQKLWQGFEQWLVEQFPQATRIVTPFNDPIARSIEEYQTFLNSLGFESVAKAAFGKKLSAMFLKSGEIRAGLLKLVRATLIFL